MTRTVADRRTVVPRLCVTVADNATVTYFVQESFVATQQATTSPTHAAVCCRAPAVSRPRRQRGVGRPAGPVLLRRCGTRQIKRRDISAVEERRAYCAWQVTITRQAFIWSREFDH